MEQLKGLPIITQWRLAWLQGKKHFPLAGAFLEYMRQEKDNIIRRKFHWHEPY